MSRCPANFLFDLLLFDDSRNVDDAASTHGALPRLDFAFVAPFMSTLHTCPLHHFPLPSSNLGVILRKLNFFPQKNEHPLQMNLCGTQSHQRFLFVSPADLTSTLFGIKEIFLPHLGHFPSWVWIISSGGFRSEPSYRIKPHFSQTTCWGNVSQPL